MEKLKSLKEQSWQKKDYLSVIGIYVLNLIIFAGLSFLALKNLGVSIKEVFEDNGANFLNYFVLLAILFGFLAVYLLFGNKDFIKDAKNSEIIFLCLEVSFIICFLFNKISIYFRPFAIAGLLAFFLTNKRVSIFVNCLFCVTYFLFQSFAQTLLGAQIYQYLYFFIFDMATGIIGIYCVKGIYSRLSMLLMGLWMSIPVILCNVLPIVVFDKYDIELGLLYGFISGPTASMMAIILLPVFETLFKKATTFKLAELTNHKSPLIGRLIETAPGTFNHAIIVSNIAEACAISIGEDALLARACAYYHDIGKLRRPEYFRENQVEETSPHDDLTPELSANIIKSHTEDGYDFALKNKLPREIANACREHHGTMPILYFYDKAKKFTDGEVPISKYCYNGPKPQSKISAIIMIADGAEAAARTLKDRSREKVTEIVKKIIDERMKLGQFDECDITLKELEIISFTVVNSLTGIYHKRIQYPKMKIEQLEEKIEETKKDKDAKD
ncbi:MAG: HDIG domain-containing protein [Clostridia bacterium]|nr:HDIG domain-containing protein [Clostridia bacterium]